MSSLSPLPAATGAATAAFLRPSLLPPKKSASQLSAYKSRKPYSPHFARISCKTSSSDKEPNNNDQTGPTTRRDILIGMGSLYGAASSLSDPTALANPLQPPDLSKCHPAIKGDAGDTADCCPPFSDQIEFKLPSPKEPMRIRPAAHLVDKAYIDKYEKAISLMKALPDDDPRSFKNQANVHCAYCNGAYDQVGITPSVALQIHFSWIFFPFHRYYLYFFERILGKLIDDPTFALPFWNWDSPDGMQIPAIFADPASPLYDAIRAPDHLPGGSSPLVDLDWSRSAASLTPEAQWQSNRDVMHTQMRVMHTQMVSGAKKRTLFFGTPLKAGDAAANTGQGSIERSPHMNIHIWTGDPKQAHTEDMGNFYSAGRDPIFYCHHANVDRMWDLWKTLGPRRTDFTDPDWLEAAFVFYDEDKNLVRCKVKDCLDSRKLNYDYQKVPLPWLDTKRTPKAKKKTLANAFATEKFANAAPPKKRELTPLSAFPLVLNKAISVVVPRGKRSRTVVEKEEEEEILVVEGIEFDRGNVVKFDVALNDEDDTGVPAGPQDTEFAGTFVNVPHREKQGAPSFKAVLRLGITDLLEDLGADDDDTVVVTLVPKVGEVKIGGLKIDYITD
ncbi:unnamed protein product [Linum tenue]|uniref:Tyrosinase copper-binding domain-containing protein n=1 Tax=Linum tenue TaxID=586396 RepID=A0AAV0PD91_9ROSI|nr:unnamed protein product [Linum tenue]